MTNEKYKIYNFFLKLSKLVIIDDDYISYLIK